MRQLLLYFPDSFLFFRFLFFPSGTADCCNACNSAETPESDRSMISCIRSCLRLLIGNSSRKFCICHNIVRTMCHGKSHLSALHCSCIYIFKISFFCIVIISIQCCMICKSCLSKGKCHLRCSWKYSVMRKRNRGIFQFIRK